MPLFFGISIAILILVLSLILALKSGSGTLQNTQTVKTKTGTSRAPTPIKTAEHLLTIEQPVDGAVVQDPNLVLSGKTAADSTVVIITGGETQIADIGASGNFNFNLTLPEGPTTIEVSSFAQNGEEQSASREVFYSKETF
ncbi:MAG: hypothetical protein Q8P89_01570 [bacterium]|nr:hypothetical protein [bacterium]